MVVELNLSVWSGWFRSSSAAAEVSGRVALLTIVPPTFPDFFELATRLMALRTGVLLAALRTFGLRGYGAPEHVEFQTIDEFFKNWVSTWGWLTGTKIVLHRTIICVPLMRCLGRVRNFDDHRRVSFARSDGYSCWM